MWQIAASSIQSYDLVHAIMPSFWLTQVDKQNVDQYSQMR